MKVLTAYDHTECSKAALDDPRNAGRHDGANKATEEGETSREGAVHKEKGRFDLESGPISARELSRSRDSPVVPSHDELTPLVPLVKVAWAEGRITRRERELIFMAAEKMGIVAGSPSHDRLSGWLEFHPTDDFYFHSLNRLNSYWANLPDDEKSLRRLDLLSDCINIAEASGGTRRYPAGGRRVCDEELVAVKRIAEKVRSRGRTDDGAASV